MWPQLLSANISKTPETIYPPPNLHNFWQTSTPFCHERGLSSLSSTS